MSSTPRIKKNMFHFFLVLFLLGNSWADHLLCAGILLPDVIRDFLGPRSDSVQLFIRKGWTEQKHSILAFDVLGNLSDIDTLLDWVLLEIHRGRFVHGVAVGYSQSDYPENSVCSQLLMKIIEGEKKKE